MTIDPANLSSAPLVARVKNILLKPKEEWERIEAEEAEVRALYMGYVVPLAALWAICFTIGQILFRWNMGGFSVHLNPLQALISGLFQFALAIACTFALGWVVNKLAPNFGAQPNPVQAHKVAAYGSTAGLLAGVFSLHPWLGIFTLLGLYSLALIWFGLPKLMKPAAEKEGVYFASVVGLWIAAAIVLALIVTLVRAPFVGAVSGMPAFSMTQSAPQSSEVTLPGGGSVDLTELEREAQAYASSGPAIDPARLQEQLPQSLPGGFQLAAASSSSATGVSQAEGEYRNGDARIDVTIVHNGAMAALAALAAGETINENRSDADGYARMQTIDGRIYTEEVSPTAGTATFAVVGRGVALTAEGAGVTVDQVRAAVETISIQRLERQFGA